MLLEVDHILMEIKQICDLIGKISKRAEIYYVDDQHLLVPNVGVE